MNLAISVPVSDLSPSFIERVRQAFGQKKVVLLPEKDYKEMLKAKRNVEYLAKLNSSVKQLKDGKAVTFTIEELEAMAK
ncbi:MAG: hypothetical protein FWC15_04275 [Fibromonadales bacterium]|nr:hypothetical protein [Fibromonadales bacterium]